MSGDGDADDKNKKQSCFHFRDLLVVLYGSGSDRLSIAVRTDSRVADVDPRADLVEVLGGPAVEAAVVRQQVVELLQRHLEARHVRPVRHLFSPLGLHPVSAVISQLSGWWARWLEVVDGCPLTRLGWWASPAISGGGSCLGAAEQQQQ